MKKGCWNCAGNTDGIGCVDCLAGDTPSNWRAVAVQKTKADRIRAMSDEELADFLDKCEGMGYSDSSVAKDKNGHCVDMLDWLRYPAEED